MTHKDYNRGTSALEILGKIVLFIMITAGFLIALGLGGFTILMLIASF